MLLTTERENTLWMALVVTWLRIHLAMQEMPVQFLVEENPSRSRAAEPAHHFPWSPCPTARGDTAAGRGGPALRS